MEKHLSGFPDGLAVLRCSAQRCKQWPKRRHQRHGAMNQRPPSFARVVALMRSYEAANVTSPARSIEVDETEVNGG